MKVALILSGLTRTLSYSWLFIDKYIATPLKADIFLHTWDIDHSSAHGLAKGNYAGQAQVKNADIGIGSPDIPLDRNFNAPSVPLETSKEDYIINEVNPTSYVIEPFESFSLKEESHSTFAMYYGIQKANLLRKQYEKDKGISYDLIIRARLDTFFENTIPNKDIEEALTQNTLFVGCNRSEEDYPHQETTDVFAFSNSSIMDIYADTFNLYNNGNNRHLLGEQGLHHQLVSNQVKVKWSHIPLKLPSVWSSSEIRVNRW